jgi:outer membrane receptor for ferrienterochelin and colicins
LQIVTPAVLGAWLACTVSPAFAQSDQPQDRAPLIVEVVAGGKPVAGAQVVVGDRTIASDRDGRAVFDVAPGSIEITVRSPLHLQSTTRATIAAGTPNTVQVPLEPLPEVEDVVIVTATRTNTRLADQPVRVEVIGREEIEEKALMTPGSVAMLLGETSGLRVQTTAPSLGAANVRIQGLRGRYSQLVADGLPLYGAQGDSFSLLQVPPLDLDQVEIIKGVASALYGASALGGVINLVSRRPVNDDRELLINRTSQAGTDVSLWLADALSGGWALSLLGGYHGQRLRDLDEDGWSEVPAFDRGVLRPRLFFDNGRGRSLFATLGVMAEQREGGTLPGRAAPDGRPFEEALSSRRIDGGFAGRWLTAGQRLIALRGSAMRQSQDRRFGTTGEFGVRATWFGEASIQGVRGRHVWVAGTSFQQDRFDSRELPHFDYRFSSPSAFGQDEISFGPRWTVALSGRADFHSEYGTLATPRVSVLARPTPGWTIRLATGTGAFTPTPFTEETEETGLSRVLPLAGLRAERARGASVDVTRTLGTFEVTGTLFGSVVDHPLGRRVIDGTHVSLVNLGEPARTWGTELLVRYRSGGFTALATHAWTRSTELDPDVNVRREVPLTPDHTGSLNAMWEGQDWGRFGIEAYYVGRQALEDNPYREHGKAFFLIGALVERRWGRARWFLNSENLLNVRQTRYDPLTLPARRPDGRWTVDAWAPLDGLVVNGGVRLTLGPVRE